MRYKELVTVSYPPNPQVLGLNVKFSLMGKPEQKYKPLRGNTIKVSLLLK